MLTLLQADEAHTRMTTYLAVTLRTRRPRTARHVVGAASAGSLQLRLGVQAVYNAASHADVLLAHLALVHVPAMNKCQV